MLARACVPCPQRPNLRLDFAARLLSLLRNGWWCLAVIRLLILSHESIHVHAQVSVIAGNTKQQVDISICLAKRHLCDSSLKLLLLNLVIIRVLFKLCFNVDALSARLLGEDTKMLLFWCLFGEILDLLDEARNRDETSTVLVAVIHKFLDITVLEVSHFRLFKNLDDLLCRQNLVFAHVLDLQQVIEIDLSVENLARCLSAVLKLLLGDVSTHFVDFSIFSKLLAGSSSYRLRSEAKVPFQLLK